MKSTKMSGSSSNPDSTTSHSFDSDDRISRAPHVLDKCTELLKTYRSHSREALEKGNQQEDPPAVMLLRSFEFGLRTIAGIKSLLANDRDNALLACTLCRPFYETGTRLLWASRAPDGWLRLQKHWAKEDQKWAREARSFPKIAQAAQDVFNNRQEVLDRLDKEGRPAPSIQQMLQEIEDCDHSTGQLDEAISTAGYDYTNIYRRLSQGAHGHMVAIGRPADYLDFAVYGTVKATSADLRATCYLGASDPGAEIQGLHAELIEAIKDYLG